MKSTSLRALNSNFSHLALYRQVRACLYSKTEKFCMSIFCHRGHLLHSVSRSLQHVPKTVSWLKSVDQGLASLTKSYTISRHWHHSQVRHNSDMREAEREVIPRQQVRSHAV